MEEEEGRRSKKDEGVMLISYFVRPRFVCWTPKNPKNIIFFPWGCENI